jgi:hypothetical protein
MSAYRNYFFMGKCSSGSEWHIPRMVDNTRRYLNTMLKMYNEGVLESPFFVAKRFSIPMSSLRGMLFQYGRGRGVCLAQGAVLIDGLKRRAREPSKGGEKP